MLEVIDTCIEGTPYVPCDEVNLQARGLGTMVAFWERMRNICPEVNAYHGPILCVGFATGLFAGYVLALCTTQERSKLCSDQAVETEGVSSVEVSQVNSSSSSCNTRMIGGDLTFLTNYGSVYHSPRDCGKLKAARTRWESFYQLYGMRVWQALNVLWRSCAAARQAEVRSPNRGPGVRLYRWYRGSFLP